MGMYTGGYFPAYTQWCPNLPHAACCNTASASQTNGKHSITARLLDVYLACQLSVMCFILLLFLIGWEYGGTYMHVHSSAFYAVKPNSLLHCYIERKDAVHCWNAASSWVRISILETANIGSCILLNPVACVQSWQYTLGLFLHHWTRQSPAHILALKSNSVSNCVSLPLMGQYTVCTLSGVILSIIWETAGFTGWQVS